MLKLYKTNDFFNMDRIKWYDIEIETYQQDTGQVVVPSSYKYSLEYSDVNNWNKFTTFNGSSVKRFEKLDDALFWIEKDKKDKIEMKNRIQIEKEFEQYKIRNKKCHITQY